MERPFFYRLSDPRPRESTSDIDTIKLTIRDEIERILSTRSNGSVNGERNIFNFGIPNLVETSNSSTNIQFLVQDIREAIEAYEPRLKNVKVRFDKTGCWKSQPFHISADLFIDGIEEKFTVDI